MTKSRRFSAWGWAAGLMAAFVVLAGCDRAPSLAELEERERASRLYTNAMDDLQAGRLEPAIKGFERVVLQEPKSYSAHFQLATLLQDVRKDYISAIAHYRSYLALRPASDKATVAQDRVKLCETLLSAEMIRKAGGSAGNKLAADNEKLTAARDELAAQVKKLESELEKAQREVARLEAENKARSRTIAKLQEAVEGPAANRGAALKTALAEIGDERAEAARRNLKPTDAELLDDDDDVTTPNLRDAKDVRQLKDDLARLDAETPPSDPKTPGGAKKGKAADATAGKTAGGKVSAHGKTSSVDQLLGNNKDKTSSTLRPETYTVQDGDTLYKISQRFYGSSRMWRQIQEANRAIVPADGRLSAGQVLKLP